MASKKSAKIVTLILIATPIICLLLGILARTKSNHDLNDDGTDWSQALPYLGVGLGLIGSVVGLAVGAITASLTRKSRHANYAVYGYLLPASVAILYMVYVLVLNT